MNRILVGLDGSEREPKVLRAARDLAEKAGGRLILARAISLPVELPPRALVESPDRVVQLLAEIANQHLDDVSHEVPASLLDKKRVVVGTPWSALCDLAKEERADLLVVGSHGYGGIDRLLGTTAAKVVNHAPCSVLVVR